MMDVTESDRRTVNRIRQDRVGLGKDWHLVVGELRIAKTIVDLWYGTNSYQGLLVGAETHFYSCEMLPEGSADIERPSMRQFVNRLASSVIDVVIPFRDKRLDSADGQEVHKHVEGSLISFKGMTRLDEDSVMTTKSFSGESAFDRRLYKSFVPAGGCSPWSSGETSYENQLFGRQSTRSRRTGEPVVDSIAGHFDTATNDGDWCKGDDGMDCLSSELRLDCGCHSHLSETKASWEGSYEFLCIG